MGIADKAKTTAEDLVGKAKEAIGDATDNDSLKAEGKTDQAKSDVKGAERTSRTPSRSDLRS